jgi:hypothetical protein
MAIAIFSSLDYTPQIAGGREKEDLRLDLNSFLFRRENLGIFKQPFMRFMAHQMRQEKAAG